MVAAMAHEMVTGKIIIIIQLANYYITINSSVVYTDDISFVCLQKVCVYLYIVYSCM